MKAGKPFLLISCILLMCIESAAVSGDEVQRISYTRLNDSVKIVGSLGRFLGEIITVEGIIIDGSRRRIKSETGKTLLKVITVNGKKLGEPVIIPFSIFTWTDVKMPKVNDPFKFIGYESGEMAGIPQKAFQYMPQVATTDYHFFVYFQVCGEAD